MSEAFLLFFPDPHRASSTRSSCLIKRINYLYLFVLAKMEHLPRPQKVFRSLGGRVSYFCKKPYDGGPFLEYPERETMPREFFSAEILSAAEGNASKHHFRGFSPAKIEEFFQRWLFFGLLNLFLGEDFDSEDFLTTTGAQEQSPTSISNVFAALKIRYMLPQQKALSTDRLEKKLGLWVDRTKRGRATLPYEHFATCLRVTLNALCCAPPEFNPSLKLCIASVAEVLAFATNQAFSIETWIENNKCPMHWRFAVDRSYWVEELKLSGWCPAQIEIILETTKTVQTVCFLVYLGQDQGLELHKACTPEKCSTSQPDLDNYETRHTLESCKCHFISTSCTEMARTLHNGSYPLIQLATETSPPVTVNLAAAGHDTPFVAISHVWADGLGNRSANALPECQIKSLHSLASGLPSLEGKDLPPQETRIWCDTLCCPRFPVEARRSALAGMGRVYKEASHVLVLDSYIRRFQSNYPQGYEPVARILTSNWLRRLWTFQEAALPTKHEKLWFQFSDRAISLQAIWAQALADLESTPFRYGLALDTMFNIHDLRFRGESIASEDVFSADLSTIEKALKHRSVSFLPDEPLLIGMMLGLDLRFMLDGPDESRMQRLWTTLPRAMRGIPADIIFWVGPRLEGKGYRWAPATFLKYYSENGIMLNPLHVSSTALSRCGLTVQMPGYSISQPARIPTMDPWKIAGQQWDFFILRGEGQWYQIAPRGADAPLSQTSLHQLMRRNTDLRVVRPLENFEEPSRQFTKVTMALLVQDRHERCQSNDQSQCVKSLSNINLRVMSTKIQVTYQAAYQCAERLAATEIGQKAFAPENASEKPECELSAGIRSELHRLAASVDEASIQGADFGTSPNLRFKFEVIAAMIFMGFHLEISPVSSAPVMWCVD